jgi:Ca2+-binding EF-hand superfamily protein
MKKICCIMAMACVFLSLFTFCSEDNKEETEVVPAILTVEGTTISVDAEASEASFAVSSNKDWTAEASEIWVTLSPASGKAGNKQTIEVAVSANTETSPRQVVVVVKAEDKTAEVNIEQKGKVVISGIEIADDKFKQYLLEYFDANADGAIVTEEAEAVTGMDCSGREIESLSGIEYFVHLDTLVCHSNRLGKMDLSKNEHLLLLLDCSDNSLDSLGVTANVRLKDLFCRANELAELDVTANADLATLDCGSNRLTAVDVSKNLSLSTLVCPDNAITALDLSNNSELTKLICRGNKLTTLDVSKNPLLDTLDCTGNESLETLFLAEGQTIACLLYDEDITEIVYPHPPLPEKKYVNIPDSMFKAYMVENFDTDKDGEISEEEAQEVKVIRCSQREIASLEGIASCTNLEILTCGRNRLRSLDVSNNRKLEELDCSANEVGTLDLSKNPALTRLLCYSCRMPALDIRSNVALEEVNCHGNYLRTLNVASNTALRKLFCQKNYLSSLDLRKNRLINTLNCRENPTLTAVYLDENQVIETLYMNTPPTSIVYPNYLIIKDPAFREYLINNFDGDGDGRLSETEAEGVDEIDCSELNISSLEGIERFTNLTSLACSGNKLATIDVRSNTALVTLRCDSNRLTRLDVSGNTALEVLSCGRNEFLSLDVSANRELKSLACNGNRLLDLDVSNNTKLESLLFHDNLVSLAVYLDNNLSLKTVNCKNNSKLRALYLKPGQSIENLIKDNTTEIRYVPDNTPKYADIPDAKFKAFLLKSFDADKDGEISEEEAKTVTSIQCSSSGISSLSGIEFFTNLWYLVCDNNNITGLFLSGNQNLVELNCYANNISNIDLEGCPYLKRLICASNDLARLDVSKNRELTRLDCSLNRITTLNIRPVKALDRLVCTDNPGLTILLTTAQKNSLSIQADADVTLEEDSDTDVLPFEDTAFENYLVSVYDTNKDGGISEKEARAVTKIDCRNSNVKSLKGIEAFTNLKELECSYSRITGQPDLSKNTQLTHVNCSGNEITAMDLSMCPSLSVFICAETLVGELDVSKNLSLILLDCVYNEHLHTIYLKKDVQDSSIVKKDAHTEIRYK